MVVCRFIGKSEFVFTPVNGIAHFMRKPAGDGIMTSESRLAEIQK